MNSFSIGSAHTKLLGCLLTALAMVLVLPAAQAQDDDPPKKKPVVSFDNDDAKKAPEINVIRDKPKQKSRGSIEDADAEEGEEGADRLLDRRHRAAARGRRRRRAPRQLEPADAASELVAVGAGDGDRRDAQQREQQGESGQDRRAHR